MQAIGSELLVHDREHAMVHRVTGASGSLLEALSSDEFLEVDERAVGESLDAGLLIPVFDDSHVLSRRRVLGLVATAGATLGLVTLVLPSVDAAASSDRVFDYSGTPEEPGNGFFVGQRVGASQILIEWYDNGTAVTFDFALSGAFVGTGRITGGRTSTLPGWTSGAVTVNATPIPSFAYLRSRSGTVIYQ